MIDILIKGTKYSVPDWVKYVSTEEGEIWGFSAKPIKNAFGGIVSDYDNPDRRVIHIGDYAEKPKLYSIDEVKYEM